MPKGAIANRRSRQRSIHIERIAHQIFEDTILDEVQAMTPECLVIIAHQDSPRGARGSKVGQDDRLVKGGRGTLLKKVMEETVFEQSAGSVIDRGLTSRNVCVLNYQGGTGRSEERRVGK